MDGAQGVTVFCEAQRFLARFCGFVRALWVECSGVMFQPHQPARRVEDPPWRGGSAMRVYGPYSFWLDG